MFSLSVPVGLLCDSGALGFWPLGFHGYSPSTALVSLLLDSSAASWARFHEDCLAFPFLGLFAAVLFVARVAFADPKENLPFV